MLLADTTGDDDIFMNDALVNEGLAIFTYQKQQIPKLDKNKVPQVNHIHLFPTFNELEFGTVPSAAEVFKLTKSGISVQVLYPHYFIPNYDLDDIQELDLVEDQDLLEGEHEYLAATDDSQIGACSTAEPRWMELCDDVKVTISNLSELNINSPSTPEPSPSCHSSPNPETVYAKSNSLISEIVYAKPVLRSPSGCGDMCSPTQSHLPQPQKVNGDGLKGGLS